MLRFPRRMRHVAPLSLLPSSLAHTTGEAKHPAQGYPHPGCFGKRGCKLLKTKDGECKKRGKRLQAAGRKGFGATCRRESFQVTQERMSQVWTYVNSKLVSAIA